MSINEEKKPMFFVWEKRQGEVRGITYSAARYREMPMTGTGQKRDAERYVFVQELKPEEETDSLNVLIARYPCPIKPEGKTITPRSVDLSRNELGREAKRDQLNGLKIPKESIDKILTDLYGPEPV